MAVQILHENVNDPMTLFPESVYFGAPIGTVVITTKNRYRYALAGEAAIAALIEVIRNPERLKLFDILLQRDANVYLCYEGTTVPHNVIAAWIWENAAPAQAVA